MEFRPLDNLPILSNDPWTGDYLYLPLQDPIHDELCRGILWPDTSGDNYIGVQDDESHLAFRRWRTTRA